MQVCDALFVPCTNASVRMCVAIYALYLRTYIRQARQPGLLVGLKCEDNDATMFVLEEIELADREQTRTASSEIR